MSQTLKGRVALVNGGLSGLGAAVAEALAARGAEVAIGCTAVTPRARARLAALEARGVHGLCCDPADPAAARRLVERVVSRLGPLDILVHSAGEANCHDPDWALSVMSAVVTTCAAMPLMAEGGRIIFTAGFDSIRNPARGLAEYEVSRVAIADHADSVAREMRPRGVTVNVVRAGVLPGNMTVDTSLGGGTLREVCPARCLETPADMASLIAALAGRRGAGTPAADTGTPASPQPLLAWA
ncbi:SDR family NAD(P)-dependent oxidoreductase [Oceanicella sp. SM1341]|uniref:SDR family NAD(P)-dependent oxidoreductase n=1 Tax=Oceanicella sp. SM1341 TaxID=1548889 RepID=UPI000E470884|nr:SDR family oxidoreductase [Oceanicella sp. SM1341]